MLAEQTASPNVEEKQLGGKYLTFFMGDEEYGIEILKVRDIIGMMAITPVPRTPEFVKGVLNLRGKIIPVIDLRTKFRLDTTVKETQTCIIVVDLGKIKMGIVIDKVSEVLDIASKDIEKTPSFGVNLNTDFILGMGKIAERVVILLDINLVLTEEEIGVLHSMPDVAK
jgi:purine-binding chemotaxis protein CheW